MIRSVYIYKDDIAKLTLAVERMPHIETGGFIMGTVTPGSVRIEEVFAPNIDIARYGASLTVGGSYLADIVEWKLLNFNRLRPRMKFYRDSWKYEVVGYWHSHHTIGLERLSGTDIHSMEERLKDGLSVQVWPLANIRQFHRGEMYHRGATVGVNNSSEIVWNFFVLWPERVNGGWHNDGPVQISPTIIDSAKAERVLIPLSWKFSQPALYAADIDKLRAYECSVFERYDDDPEDDWLRHRFTIRHKAWKKQLSISVPWNFPHAAPIVKVISLENPKGDIVPIKGYNWREGDSLFTVVLHVWHKGYVA